MTRLMGIAVFLCLVLFWFAQFAADGRVQGQEQPDPVPTRGYLTAPGDLPNFEALREPGELGDGYLFVSMFGQTDMWGRYNMILDDNGEPIYYEQQEGNRFDFKKQPNGELSFYTDAGDVPAYALLNDRYEVVREITAVGADPESGQDYEIDNHELQILENGEVLFLVHDEHIVDMSELIEGGNEEAVVVGCVIQIVDSDDALLFQWRSWEHIPITDTHVPLDREPLRYIHCNAVEEDSDGNLLLTARNLDEVIKISRETGEMLWRMGGKHNEFTFLNDRGFSVQHDARRLANGHITVYDNSTPDGLPSRGVEYEVDETRMTVKRVAEFSGTPDVFGRAMGNMQRLTNDSTVIGWGRTSQLVLTEFDAQGKAVLEIRGDDPLISYRAFRFPWQGYPTQAPALVAYAAGNMAHLHFSWNGSTETVAYLVSSARTPDGLTPLFKVDRAGFETTFDYSLPAEGFTYFQVRPIDGDGRVGPASNSAFVVAGGGTSYLPLINSQ